MPHLRKGHGGVGFFCHRFKGNANCRVPEDLMLLESDPDQPRGLPPVLSRYRKLYPSDGHKIYACLMDLFV